MSKIETQCVHIHGDEMYDPSLSAGKLLPNDDSAPPYGQPLTYETVKLVKPGDFVKRHIGEHCGVSAGAFCVVTSAEASGIQVNVGDPVAIHDARKFSFIARADPNNPGWYLAPEGGFPENPVPGKWVYTVGIDGTEFPLHRSDIAHWTHTQFQVTRFRIVDEPASEQPVQPKETVADVVGRLKEGDVCEFTFRALRRGGVFDFGDASCLPPQLERHISSIEILPPIAKPVTVGEGVMWGAYSATVKVVSGPQVCIMFADGGLGVRPMRELSRPDGTPIAESE